MTTTTAVNPKDKVALVTGSTSGIGLATARCLAKRGVNIILTGSRDESLVTSIVEELRSYGVRVDYLACDLTNLSNINTLWSDVLRLYENGIDILINNAGMIHLGDVENFPDEKYDQSIALNLTAPFHLTKRCLPKMKTKGWGRIVNVSSTYGFVSRTNFAIYSATKHGLIGFTKGVALETAQNGITCNAVCPTTTQTPMAEQSFNFAVSQGLSASEVSKSIAARIPTGKPIKPEQVAELIEFLCLSNASSQMTGAAYMIDGGVIAQ